MRSLTLLFACASTVAIAQPPPGYYDPAEGLSGEALQNALYEIISPHNIHLYSELWGDFESTDERDDNANKVWDIYSDIPGGTAPYLYTFVTDQCGTYNGEGDCFNREHSVPQSWFDSNTPMVSDLFHIYPTDGWVNQKRGDLPYGLVGSIDFESDNGTKTGNSVTPGYSGTVCEPIDAFKGDLARTYFYMMTRYTMNVNAWNSDMFVNNDLSPWAENLLVAWSDADPVSQKEIDRNNAIYAIQNNRNPYIDRPEWVHYVWGPTAGVPERTVNGPQCWTANGRLIVPSNNNGASFTITIMDAIGRSLKSDALPSSGGELDLTAYHGCCLALVENAGQRTALRFVLP